MILTPHEHLSCFHIVNESVNAPAIRDVISKITVVPDGAPEQFEAEVSIKMANGTEIKYKLDLRSLEVAVSVAEWESIPEAKCSDLLQGAFPLERTTSIVSALRNLEETDNI